MLNWIEFGRVPEFVHGTMPLAIETPVNDGEKLHFKYVG